MRNAHAIAWIACAILAASVMLGCGRSGAAPTDAPASTIDPDLTNGPAPTDVAASPATDVVTNETGSTTDVGSDPKQFTREQALIASLTIFALSVFLGFELITKVPPTLHTPLMSGSNAISGIAIVGAALMAANNTSRWAMFFGLVAVVMASVNVVGGFLVTDRMLSMFKKK